MNQISIYQLTVPQLKKMLFNLNHLLSKAQVLADSKKFDSQVFMQTRLTPDMLPFIKQIQMACDGAKFCVSRLTGQTAPAHEDNETTIKEAQGRIEKVIKYLNTIKESDFENWNERKVTVPWVPGQFMKAEDYVIQMVIPNVYFHITTAYAILRQSGVDIGKVDYLGELPFRPL